ncbi:alpha/beta fold hydrolase [Amycolatopsis sp. NPDC051371]|uniref:alpha/beta fold hydrolase n=1 Tax=Amycolatopsis sp. NPDC051371 TaxID=3155800 RepID=UPI00343B3089
MKLGEFASVRAEQEYRAVYERGLAALPAPTGQRDIETSFGIARVYRFGSGPATPAVLLPGRAGTAVMWAPNLPAWSRRGPVYAIDLLGEPGRSVQTAPIRDGADQATWLTEVLDALGPEAVHLIGYSFGGWLAANYAARTGRRLASLTLIDPVRTFGEFPVPLLVRTTLALVPGLRRWGRPAFLRWIAGGAEVAPEDPVAAVIEAGMRTYRIGLPTPELLSDGQLRSIAIPVLALIAGKSVMHDAAKAGARARTLLPDARVEVWPQATHAIAGESAAAVNERVLAFLDEADGGRGTRP